MNSFWGGFSERFSQTGRTAPLFIFIILLMGGGTILALSTNLDIPKSTIVIVAIVFGLWLITVVVGAFLQFRESRRNRYSIQPLSQRELNNARAKLKKG